MLAELLQSSELAQWLRQSIWLYPVVNALHILGFVLLLGATIVLDLRLLGLWCQAPIKLLYSIVRPVIVTGFVTAVFFGLLLFITSAVDYLNATFFIAKLCTLTLAIVNAILLQRSSHWRFALEGDSIGFVVKCQALLSLCLWIIVLFLGRFIAYR